DQDALAELAAHCAARDLRAKAVPVDYASHSAQVAQIKDEVLAALADIAPVAGRVPLFSTLTGNWLDTSRMDAEYWYRNLRSTVRFDTAIRALVRQGHSVFIEASPHPALPRPVQGAAEEAGAAEAGVGGTLRRDEGGLRRALASAAELWVRGVPVDWHVLFEGSGARRIDLPTYPFQRRRFWL